MAYTIEQTNRDVVTLRHTVAAGWRQRYLLLADVHFDSPHCDRRRLKALLQEAQETGAGVFCFGDWFDAMQGRNDKRGDKSDLLPAYKDEFDMAGGFHVERGRAPRPQGAYWLEFRHDSGEHGRVDFDVARA